MKSYLEAASIPAGDEVPASGTGSRECAPTGSAPGWFLETAVRFEVARRSATNQRVSSVPALGLSQEILHGLTSRSNGVQQHVAIINRHAGRSLAIRRFTRIAQVFN